MKVTMQCDYRDFAETNYQIWKTQKDSSGMIFTYILTSLCLAGISSIPVFLFVSNRWSGVLTFLIIFLLSLYLHRIPTKSSFLNEYRKSFGNNSFEVEIELTERGIFTKQIGNEYLFGWENLIDVREIENRLFFIINGNSGVSIPLKAFESSNQIGQFIAFAKSRITSENLLEK